MNKKVNIIEAIKANEHSRVRRVGADEWFNINELLHPDVRFVAHAILEEWEIEPKPHEVWCNIYSGSNLDYSYHILKEDADNYHKFNGRNRIRCVKMREVVE